MFWAILSLALGGIVKGATGAGAPVVAVPVLALFYGVDFAVTTMMVPNLLSNVWQGWAYRRDRLPGRFSYFFGAAGMAGAAAGTWLLATLSPDLLKLAVACIVVLYIVFRLARPGWRLAMSAAITLAGPVGFLGGVMQGAAGMSGPVSISFLNALRLERPVFIGTISLFFVAMSLSQVPALFALGIMTGERLLISFGALAVTGLFMPVGSWMARHVSKETFDRLLLVLLAVIAAKIFFDALAG